MTYQDRNLANSSSNLVCASLSYFIDSILMEEPRYLSRYSYYARAPFSAGPRHFSLLQNAQTSSEVHSASYSVGFSPRKPSSGGVNLTSHLYPVPRLRLSGAVPLLSLYDFIVRTGNLALHIGVVFKWRRRTTTLPAQPPSCRGGPTLAIAR
jgi:hypothetical protein